MSIKKFTMLLLSAMSMAALISGCGSSSKEGASTPADVAKVNESSCRICHSTSVEPVTGSNIVPDYLASAHYTVPNARSSYPDGVGCQGCHGGGAQHNGVGPLPYPDPDAAGKCFECHKNYLSAAHFKAYTTNAGARPAMYASKNYQNDCTACHDPHKADKAIGQEHKDWAESGHGDVNGLAWANRDFKASTSCIRCHTATGYINYVESGFTAPTATWATAGDFTREVATCKVCHTSYNFKNSIRAVPAVTAAYKENFETTNVNFPDTGPSNICITCHAGRESGQSIRDAADATFTDKSFVNPHYLAAAATLFAKGGYHYYAERVSNVLTYDNYSTGNGFSHGRVGMEGRISRPAAGTGSYGPCVGCHLGATNSANNSRSHTFSPVNTALASGATGCIGCHGGENIALLIEEEKVLADRAMAFFLYNLNLDGIYYDPINHPYFVKTAGAKANVTANQLKNWVYSATNLIGPATGTAKNTMGAAFNFKILNAEKGSHVHNRTYTRRLIFDSVQYLQKGAVTYSNQSIPATGKPNINDVISFTNYSTLITPVGGGAPNDGNTTTISALKSYLVRASGGNFFRR